MKKQKDQLQLFVASSESLKGLFKAQTVKQPVLVQLAQWFAGMCSEGKPVTGHMIIERPKCWYVKMKTTDRCTFSDGWL
jgi:hypothetical protein